MKAFYPVEQFIRPETRVYLGVVLALLRIACAWAIAKALLGMHGDMPDILVQVRTQTTPFLEAWATVWTLKIWAWIIGIAGCMVALGIYTRIAAVTLGLFLVGIMIVHRETVWEHLGSWTWVCILSLLVAFFAEWGRVFGADALLARIK